MDNLSDNLDTQIIAGFERGNEDEVIQKLHEKVDARNDEIRRICNDHFTVSSF